MAPLSSPLPTKLLQFGEDVECRRPFHGNQAKPRSLAREYLIEQSNLLDGNILNPTA